MNTSIQDFAQTKLLEMGSYLSVEDEHQTESDTVNTQQSTEILKPKLNTKSNPDKINTATSKKKMVASTTLNKLMAN